MSLFLLSKNNLADVEDISQARSNLGLGNLVSQNVDTIDISGGSLTIDQFRFNNNGYDFSHGDILSTDENGNARWNSIESISDTAIKSIVSNSLSTALTEFVGFPDLENYLQKDLSDVYAETARSNLGLTNPTFEKVTADAICLTLTPVPSVPYNFIKLENVVDGTQKLGVHYFNTEIYNAVNDGSAPPTTDAVKNIIDQLSNLVEDATEASLGLDFVSKSDNFDDLNITDFVKVHSNLGLPFKQVNIDTMTFSMSNIIVDNLRLNTNEIPVMDKTFVTVNSDNNFEYQDLTSTSTQFGILKYCPTKMRVHYKIKRIKKTKANM